MRTANRFILTGLFFWWAVCVFAQAQGRVARADTLAAPGVTDARTDSLPAADGAPGVADTAAAQKTKVYLVHSNALSFDKAVRPDAQVLSGEVCFRHDSSYMYCDSAYFFEQTNSLEAFSNVRMEQGDTLFVYGDYLFYDGNAQVAYLREHVRMENGQVTLFTDSLNYERIPNIGYYFEGGLIVDSLNQLSSFYGQYSPGTKLAVFNDSVRLENPDFTLYSDTLQYNTASKVATLLGPSVIVADSGTIYTSRGWYDTERNTSLLLDRSQVESGDKVLIGDSIFYNRAMGLGEVFGDMSLVDTAQHVTLQGEYGYYDERTGYAFATDSARFLEYSQGDTLFLHADTLQMVTVDSVYREIKAYYGVRFFRTDVQGVCDSMQFNTRDSVLYMYAEPVLWNEQYQLYGDTIAIYLNDSTIDYAHVIQFAFAAQHVDSSYYNQLKGSDLKAYFDGRDLRRIDVNGNAELNYYPLEKDGSKVGMNYARGSHLSMWIKDNKLERMGLYVNASGSLTPIPDLKPDQKVLKDFYWFDYLRPKDRDDIYQVVKRKAAESPKRSNKFVH
ncbi:MAG: hypothetical protein J6K31_09090 [Parabacteroides sp.]|nr:hypothetical protein [Parabacteroides sp.]